MMEDEDGVVGPLRLLGVASLMALFWAGGNQSAEPPTGPQVWVDTARWQVELPADSALRVSNRLGDIRARSSGDGKLLVVAIIQRFSPEQKDADVSISRKEGQVVVETRYPSAEIRNQDGRLNGRIDLSLLVPAGLEMQVETDHGLIEIKGVKRDLTARTSSGRLRVTTGRRVSAQTGSGELRAVLKNPSVSRPARLETRDGPLRVDLLDQPDLSLRARTAGEIIPWLGSAGEKLVSRENGLSELRVGDAPFSVDALSAVASIEVRAVPANELR